MHTGFWWESQREGDHWEDVDVNGKMILKMDLREIGWGGTDLIDLAQDRDNWQTLVFTVINFWVP
jgi:hypothetical protein